ncbi:MBL fold metallo-hydrolase RNA specificity domain-containing protein [Solitalea lacus]|uniref:MBL fold metallo-hydrolase RNA specificity domain-containing protein n=1 Tax=Solitalea lacus TaxID=2911172 RepID=UPI001EDC666C|nr:MBL fold metallo-hydrolase [Solitalea lacus]UKJ07736.1 MBL fold metallo-hydrolase [Solitalea lacus]
MHITFHGAAQNVTGSKHLISTRSGKQILLDCGMFQGGGAETEGLNSHFGFNPQEVDTLILSHAHIDHCGLIPRLVKEGFSGKIYCTPATIDLTKLLLQDSARIQDADISFINKKRKREGRQLLIPLYTLKDVEACFDQFVPINYGKWFRIDNEVEVLFTDAGHIIGSAAVHLNIREEGEQIRITFSGDVGRYGTEILRSPQSFPQAQYIILESTYGNTLHDDAAPAERDLLHYIKHTCFKKGGKLIIPAFSVGRTQELLYLLNNLENAGELPPIDTFVDSPLSERTTRVVKSYPEYFNEDVESILKYDKDPFDFKGLHFVEDLEESKALNFRKEPCIIISASGMAEAGRVKHHIANGVGNEKNTILFVGYCEPNSLGGRLLNKPEVVHIFGTKYLVKAEVGKIDSLSAHGDYKDLSKFLSSQDPSKVKEVFLVHGEYEVQREFKEKLQLQGFNHVEIPYRHQQFTI